MEGGGAEQRGNANGEFSGGRGEAGPTVLILPYFDCFWASVCRHCVSQIAFWREFYVLVCTFFGRESVCRISVRDKEV